MSMNQRGGSARPDLRRYAAESSTKRRSKHSAPPIGKVGSMMFSRQSTGLVRAVWMLLLLTWATSQLPAADPANAVRAASDGWRQAVIKQDAVALGRLLADDLAYIHAGGKTESKQEYIASVTTGPARYESNTQSDTRIRVHGKVAVLSGYVDVKLVGRDSYRVRTFEVYVKNDGAWQLTSKESVRVDRRRPPA